jgi:dipeptidyl aminopeptidase/acylaminoacyl peptidase
MGSLRRLSIAACGLLALLAISAPAQAAFPGKNGKIAFTTDEGNFPDLWLHAMDADGTNPTRLTNNTADDGDPAWSPDGTKIAFDRNSDIYTMNADGTGQARVTNNPDSDFAPDWQPIPSPKRSDYKNAAQFCKAEQAFWGDQIGSHYGGRADSYGKCVSQNH